MAQSWARSFNTGWVSVTRLRSAFEQSPEAVFGGVEMFQPLVDALLGGGELFQLGGDPAAQRLRRSTGSEAFCAALRLAGVESIRPMSGSCRQCGFGLIGQNGAV